jgi:hypothetical protein
VKGRKPKRRDASGDDHEGVYIPQIRYSPNIMDQMRRRVLFGA